MTFPLQSRSVSRRTALAGLGAGALGLALTTRGLGAFAQDASPTATPFPMADHPLAGVWRFDNELRQPETDISYNIFATDGTYASTWRDRGPIAVGNWRATGARTAELRVIVRELVPQDMFVPDFAPEGDLFAPGMFIALMSLEVDVTGATVTGTGMSDGRTFDAGRGTRMEVVTTATDATPAA